MSDLSKSRKHRQSTSVEGNEDLLVVILSLLDIIELTRKKTVCKRWEKICSKVFDEKCSSTRRKPFSTVEELQNMAMKYKDAKAFETHKADKIGRIYGWPISKWDISQIGYDLSKALTYLEQGIFNDYDSTLRCFCTKTLRSMMTMEKLSFREWINTGLVPRLVDLLNPDEGTPLQVEEACWTLSHVTSGTTEEIKVVIDAGAIPSFCRLILSSNDHIYEQAIWALGNIAADSTCYRDLVLQENVMQPLLERIQHDPNIAIWALSNLCRGSPPPNYEMIKQAIPVVRHLLFNASDTALQDVCWTLCHLSNVSDWKKENKLQDVLDTGVVGRLVELLREKSSIYILTPTMRSIGNIMREDHLQIQAFIDAGILPPLLAHFSSHSISIQKDACSLISKITAGNEKQIEAVIESNIIPPLINMIVSSSLHFAMTDATQAICNAILGGSPMQIGALIKEGCTPPLCEVLSKKNFIYSNTESILMVLETIENILRVCEEDEEINENLIALCVFESGGLNNIEYLLQHGDDDMKIEVKKFVRIIQVYSNTNTRNKIL